jgi:hypothetical protein
MRTREPLGVLKRPCLVSQDRAKSERRSQTKQGFLNGVPASEVPAGHIQETIVLTRHLLPSVESHSYCPFYFSHL